MSSVPKKADKLNLSLSLFLLIVCEITIFELIEAEWHVYASVN